MPSIDYNRIADLYDTYVTTDLDVPFYLDQARGRRQVLELMSGTGRVSIPLLEAGVRLTCVDSSRAMLARMRAKVEAKGLMADIREMDVCALELPGRFGLIILPFNSFAEIVEEPAQRTALARIRDHLEPDGCFICPLHNPPSRLKFIDGARKVRGKFASGESGSTVVLSSVETCGKIPGVVHGTQFYDIFDKDDHLLEQRQADLCFYLHTPSSFGELVKEAGYRVKALYGDYDCSIFRARESPFMIWVLEKTNTQSTQRTHKGSQSSAQLAYGFFSLCTAFSRMESICPFRLCNAAVPSGLLRMLSIRGSTAVQR